MHANNNSLNNLEHMNTKKMFFAAALSMLMAGAVQAQEGVKSFSFVEAQGGVQLTSTDAKMDKLITPTAALSFGHYFTPVVGARLHVNAWESKSGYNEQFYKWKYVTPDLDLLLNLSNIFSKKQAHALNVILLGGVGLNYAWDNDDLKGLNLPANATPLAWDKNRLSHNLRAGLRVETNQAKRLGLSLEVNANSLSDRFNSKTNNSDDWMFTAMLGLSFRFNQKSAAPKYITKMVEIVDTIEVDEPYVTKEIVKRPKEVKEKKNMNEAIFFKIAQTKKLVDEHGIDASRIKTDSKGDTVQPFEENDKNRCVIITGEGTFKVTVYEDAEVEKKETRKVKKVRVRQEEVKERVD